MRLIDADALKKRIKKRLQKDNDEEIATLGYALLCIRKEKTVDAEPIVHCKDCKHKCIKGKTTRYHYCEIWKSAVDETDFCSRGEKR